MGDYNEALMRNQQNAAVQARTKVQNRASVQQLKLVRSLFASDSSFLFVKLSGFHGLVVVWVFCKISSTLGLTQKKVDLYFDGTDLLILVGFCLILVTSLYLVDLVQMIDYTSQFLLQHILSGGNRN
jgi:uncharacterized Tic20 family protein